MIRALVAIYSIAGSAAVWAGPNQWTSLGLGGGETDALAIDTQNSGTFYAHTLGGVFKSTDGGATWSETGHGTAGYQGLLAIDPQVPSTIYAATYSDQWAPTFPGGIFKSLDGGATWNALNAQLTGDPVADSQILYLAIDPQNTSTLYTGTYAGVFKSVDGGATWIAANSGLPNLGQAGPGGVVIPAYVPVLSLSVDPQNSGTLYTVAGADTIHCSPPCGGGLFKSTDGGASWAALPTSPPSQCWSGTLPLMIDPGNPATLLYPDGCDGLYRSADGGASWNRGGSGLPRNVRLFSIRFDANTSGTLYAATAYNSRGGVYKSVDGGMTWSPASSGLPPECIGVLEVDPRQAGTLYAAAGCASQQLFKSTDGAASWTTISSTLGVSAMSLLMDPLNSGTIYINTSDGTFKSTDAGTTWNPLNSTYLFAIDPQNPSTLYASVLNANELYANVVSRLSKSIDGGATWNPADAGLPDSSENAKFCVSSLAIDPENTNTLYAGIGTGNCGVTPDDGVWTSSDGGASWAMLGAQPGGGVSGLAIDPSNSQTLYASTAMGLYKSTDGGASWNKLVADYFLSFAIAPQTPNTIVAAGNSLGVIKSTDGGASWTTILGPMVPGSPSCFVALGYICPSTCGCGPLAIDPQNPSTIYVRTNRVFRSTNGGASWTVLEWTVSGVSGLAADPLNANTLYASANTGGVFVINFAP
jgi:photosystem II stability/assembly factor-like uncharacterized protein